MKQNTKSKKNEKQKEKEKEKVKEKEKEKVEKEEEDEEYFTKEEIQRLDKFHDLTDHKFTDDEIYELIEKFKEDDDTILNELKEQLKERKRGSDYEWNEVGKSK